MSGRAAAEMSRERSRMNFLNSRATITYMTLNSMEVTDPLSPYSFGKA
jgi:hypothetical protein